MASRRLTDAKASLPIRRGVAVAELFKVELRKEIQRCGLSERELSGRLGFGPTYLTNLFNVRAGHEPVALRVETLVALLLLLGISIRELIRRVERAEAAKSTRRSRGRVRRP